MLVSFQTSRASIKLLAKRLSPAEKVAKIAVARLARASPRDVKDLLARVGNVLASTVEKQVI